ncbi:hypothetical protein NA57DRAFT_71253 [Rhizodiscina lignyota]|uniref:RRM domain-containing protein n=1 Tax=Rhizodiscina lignyota TaxID=1504668 RepID=A0A9P4MF35_9PEZI|nr:hypothetical protein NA57DRAFT_71253 [Rhizodiscina lignyota]
MADQRWVDDPFTTPDRGTVLMPGLARGNTPGDGGSPETPLPGLGVEIPLESPKGGFPRSADDDTKSCFDPSSSPLLPPEELPKGLRFRRTLSLRSVTPEADLCSSASSDHIQDSSVRSDGYHSDKDSFTSDAAKTGENGSGSGPPNPPSSDEADAEENAGMEDDDTEMVDQVAQAFVEELTQERAQNDEDVGITPQNAQSVLSAKACLFVANLPKYASDAELHNALALLFESFGQCWIKVHRRNEIPCAFVQYRDEQIAEFALRAARGAVVIGRPCRTEFARAPRSLYVTRRDGQVPSQEEIMELLSPYGAVQEVVMPTPTDLENNNLPPGGWGRFEIYGNCRDAIHELRDNDTYHVRLLREPGNTWRPKPSLFVNVGLHKCMQANTSEIQNIHLRFLPPELAEADLREKFNGYGTILNVTMFQSHKRTDLLEGVISYSHFREAELAVNNEDNLHIRQGRSLHRVSVFYHFHNEDVQGTWYHGQPVPAPLNFQPFWVRGNPIIGGVALQPAYAGMPGALPYVVGDPTNAQNATFIQQPAPNAYTMPVIMPQTPFVQEPVQGPVHDPKATDMANFVYVDSPATRTMRPRGTKGGNHKSRANQRRMAWQAHGYEDSPAPQYHGDQGPFYYYPDGRYDNPFKAKHPDGGRGENIFSDRNPNGRQERDQYRLGGVMSGRVQKTPSPHTNPRDPRSTMQQMQRFL